MAATLNTSIQMQHNPTILNGLSEVIDLYDGFIIDLWGVIHNGKTLFEGVIPSLQKLKELNKKVILLSNAPRSFGTVVEKLTEMGLSRSFYDLIKTSGDYALEFIRRHPAATYYHIGHPEKDSSLLAGIGKNPVASIPEAQVLIASNLEESKPNLTDYHADFKAAAAKNIPMICANPDVIVKYGDDTVYCSGALALDYEKFGGKVYYFGKPYPKVYEDISATYQDCKFLAIGDSLATDIKGAMKASIDSVLILSGIHSHEIGAGNPETWRLFDEYQAYPSFLLKQLSL